MDSEPLSYNDILITLFLVILNGFFVAAEFAIVKVRSSQLETKAQSMVAKISKSIVHNLDAYLAATQLGITLASLALGWVGEKTMEHLIHAVLTNLSFISPADAANFSHKFAMPLGFFIITMLHIVFGELVPKSIAIRNPYRTTLFIATPLKLFRTLFLPLIYIMNGVANFILRLLGIKLHEEEVHSEEELKLIITESAEGGAIEDSERDLIHNVFEFDDRLVKQVFIHNSRVEGIPIDATMEEASSIVLEQGYSRYPIYDASLDNIIGMVHSKDILRNIIKKQFKNISDIKRDVLFVNENKRVLDLLRSFQKNKTEFGVVVDEFGATIGIITMEDILEELVGDIQDEHDDETIIVEKLDDKTFKVQSLSPLDDINEQLPFDIPKDETYETLSGYVATLSVDLPTIGDEFENEYYYFKIMTMNRKSPEVIELKLK